MYQDKINKILNSIDDVIEIAKSTATVEIYAYQKDRIFNKGEDKNETQIGTYSDTLLPAFFFNRSNNKKGKVNPKDYPNGLSYKTFRNLNGLQSAFVDLKFSGNLQQSITYTKDSIYFKNEYGKKLIGYNEVRFKKRIYAPSQPEKQIYFDILETELNKLWK